MVLMFYMFFIFMVFNHCGSLIHQLLCYPFLMFYCVILNKKWAEKIKYSTSYLFVTFDSFLVTSLLLRVECLIRTFPNPKIFILNLYAQKCLKIFLLTDLFESCKCNARNLFSHNKSGVMVQRVTLFWGAGMVYSWKGIWIGHGVNL